MLGLVDLAPNHLILAWGTRNEWYMTIVSLKIGCKYYQPDHYILELDNTCVYLCGNTIALMCTVFMINRNRIGRQAGHQKGIIVSASYPGSSNNIHDSFFFNIIPSGVYPIKPIRGMIPWVYQAELGLFYVGYQ